MLSTENQLLLADELTFHRVARWDADTPDTVTGWLFNAGSTLTVTRPKTDAL